MGDRVMVMIINDDYADVDHDNDNDNDHHGSCLDSY